MELELPTEKCSNCDGYGWDGFGGPGGRSCSSCRGTGEVQKKNFSAREILSALEGNAGYSPSGNHVIRGICQKLGIRESKIPTEDTEILSNPSTFRKVSSTIFRTRKS